MTQKQAQLWLLMDSISKLGIPGDIAFDIILDRMDLPQKEELKKRWQERQESQAKAAQEDSQMKLQLEQIKNQNSNISFKDILTAAQSGFISAELASSVMQMWIQNQFPQLQQMQQEISLELQSPEELDKMIALSQMNQPQKNNHGGNLTQPAIESLIRGITPAM